MAARKKSKAKRSTAKVTKKRVKTTKRKTTTKKTSAKAKKISSSGVGRVSKVYTKSALLNFISERTGLARKDVSSVFDELVTVVDAHLRPGGPGKFTLPGMLKMTVKKVPARKARKGINPFTGEMTTFKAKPATRKVRVTALKALKEMAV